MRKKDNLCFNLYSQAKCYKMDLDSQELVLFDNINCNLLEEDVLDKNALKEQVIFNVGYRFQTNNKKMFTVTFYDFERVNDLDAIEIEGKIYMRISNIREKTWCLREVICLETDSKVKVKNDIRENIEDI